MSESVKSEVQPFLSQETLPAEGSGLGPVGSGIVRPGMVANRGPYPYTYVSMATAHPEEMHKMPPASAGISGIPDSLLRESRERSPRSRYQAASGGWSPGQSGSVAPEGDIEINLLTAGDVKRKRGRPCKAKHVHIKGERSPSGSPAAGIHARRLSRSVTPGAECGLPPPPAAAGKRGRGRPRKIAPAVATVSSGQKRSRSLSPEWGSDGKPASVWLAREERGRGRGGSRGRGQGRGLGRGQGRGRGRGQGGGPGRGRGRGLGRGRGRGQGRPRKPVPAPGGRDPLRFAAAAVGGSGLGRAVPVAREHPGDPLPPAVARVKRKPGRPPKTTLGAGGKRPPAVALPPKRRRVLPHKPVPAAGSSALPSAAVPSPGLRERPGPVRPPPRKRKAVKLPGPDQPPAAAGGGAGVRARHHPPGGGPAHGSSPAVPVVPVPPSPAPAVSAMPAWPRKARTGTRANNGAPGGAAAAAAGVPPAATPPILQGPTAAAPPAAGAPQAAAPLIPQGPAAGAGGASGAPPAAAPSIPQGPAAAAAAAGVSPAAVPLFPRGPAAAAAAAAAAAGSRAGTPAACVVLRDQVLGEQHRQELFGGWLDWSNVERAFQGSRVEIVTIGLPAVFPLGHPLIGLTRREFAAGEIIRVRVVQ